MKPYRNAIKAADSYAVVAIYFNDAGYPEPNTWDNDLKKYGDKYWDAVVYHHYPALPTSGVDVCRFDGAGQLGAGQQHDGPHDELPNTRQQPDDVSHLGICARTRRRCRWE